jgi:hypothetical protein
LPPDINSELHARRPAAKSGGMSRIMDATDWTSQAYEREVVDRVWATAREVSGNDPALWRKDEHGAWIYRMDYGRRQSEFGWEIYDPSVGLSGGRISVLRPLHWMNYLDLVASSTQSRVTADGLRNTRRLL